MISRLRPPRLERGIPGLEGGRGREKTSTTELGSFSSELVRQARFVLRHSGDLAAKVMAGSPLGEAYKVADQQRREREEYEQLRRDAGDRLDAISDVCSRLKANIDAAKGARSVALLVRRLNQYRLLAADVMQRGIVGDLSDGRERLVRGDGPVYSWRR
jgi:hypothetical protein